MSPITKALAAALTLLGVAPAAVSASFTPDCPSVCLAPGTNNLLVTHCTIDGSPNDPNLAWGQLDLNKILGYQSNQLVYQQDGNAFSTNACGSCTVSGSTIECICLGGTSSIDLDTYMDDVTGVLCFIEDFGPICGTGTTYTC